MQRVEYRGEQSGERSNTQGKGKEVGAGAAELGVAEREVSSSGVGMKQQGDCRK